MQLPNFGPLAACLGLCVEEYGPYAALPTKDNVELRTVDRIGPGIAQPPSTRTPEPTPPEWHGIPLVQRHRLIKQVGKGGFSEIWLAETRDTHEHVAIKAVHLVNDDLEWDEIQTLLAEPKYLRSLDCPHLARYLDSAATATWVVLVMEYLAGGEMLDHIHQVDKYSEALAAKLFAQVVSAVSYLHNLNIMHRDIKPENVMFVEPVEVAEAAGRPLRLKVIDLGMAAVYDPNKTMRGCIGTPGFVAPELWHDAPHSPAGDVYALGVLLFVMLCGRKPHAGADIRTMKYCDKSILDAPGLKDERFLSLSATARELLLSMMADNPKDRPTCMAVLKHPFIAAVDSNLDAHREMGDVVRRRLHELAQLRRMYGLRYALGIQKPHGADHAALLEALEQRRLKLRAAGAGSLFCASDGNSLIAKRSHGADRGSSGGAADDGSGYRGEYGSVVDPRSGNWGRDSPFARSSLASSYASPLSIMIPPVQPFARRSYGSQQYMLPVDNVGHTHASPPASSTAVAVPVATGVLPYLGTIPSDPAGSRGVGADSRGLGAPGLPDACRIDHSRNHGCSHDAAATHFAGASRGGAPTSAAAETAAALPATVASATGASSMSSAFQRPSNLDNMAILHSLPELPRSLSMPVPDAVLGMGPEGERLGGGSPVADPSVLQAALLGRCLSDNAFMLELLDGEDLVRRIVADAEVQGPGAILGPR